MMLLVRLLSFILLLVLSINVSWAYVYDADLTPNYETTQIKQQNQHYDGTVNLCYRCINPFVENLQEKALSGSFFAFEVGLFATKGTGEFGKLFQQRVQTLREASIEFNRVGRDLQIPGGLAGAIRYTRQTGNLVGGSDHIQKGRDAVRFFNRQIKQIGNSRSIPEAGRQKLIDNATRSRDKIQNALDGN